MNKPSSDNDSLDLSSLDFGPAWAKKGGESKKQYKEYKGPKAPRGGKEGRKPRPNRSDRPQGGNKSEGQRGNARKGSGFKERRPRAVFVPAQEGIEASIMPIEAGVDNLAKEITASGRTYSVFELARVVLGARDRFSIVLLKKENGPDMFQCTHDDAVFLTKDECINHAANSEWINELYKSEEVEMEAPAGNFQNIAKCGFSGELLGPTNFHGYQDRVIELHRTKFSNLSLENYKKRIVTESGDDIVNLWKESMTKRVIYKLVADEAITFDSRSAMIQHFSSDAINEVFNKTHKAQVPSEIDAKKLSPSLLTNLKEVIQDQRRYPGALSSFLCRQLSGRQLAVFKWQGKLHCGPSRPHSLPEELTMADRPGKIYGWIMENIGGGIDELWKAVCPADIDDKAKFDWYHDLHWLINAGYVIFMNSGLLYPSSASKKPAAPQQAKKAAKKTAKKAAKKAPKVEAKAEAKEAAPEVKPEVVAKKDDAPIETPVEPTVEAPKDAPSDKPAE